MRPFITLRAFPNVLRLPRFIRERNRFAGVDMESREKLMEELCLSVSRIEKCSPAVIQTWIEKSFYPAFIDSMFLFKDSRPELNSTLSRLKKKKLRLAVLSDYSMVSERLEKLRIDLSLFDTVTSSEQFGALKPSGRPFVEIARKWNLKPSEVLVVGDRVDTDGEGAKAAGMKFTQICDKKNEQSTSWQTVRDYLLSLPEPL
ncbi:hypothetical protein CHISP_0980 [Chitinispirillum alkaliphilum]|nr:hypothetical protein CHISP_0980 [Chitinispirillum alkaliphilum]